MSWFRDLRVRWWRAFKKNMRREDGVIYQTRYHLLKTKLLSIYINVIRTPDYDPWFHNHPWRRSWSLKLRNDYTEIVSSDGRWGERVVRPGKLSRIPEFHRIVSLHTPEPGEPVTTLFIGWRSDRPWGFVNPDTGELVSWQDRVKMKGMTPEESRRL
jgi:hypothetical protein